jgi:Mg/Co/Ni transporter MgtE
MATNMNGSLDTASSSTVLGELKETIRRQAAEIATLKEEARKRRHDPTTLSSLSSSSSSSLSTSSAHAGHGAGGAPSTADELVHYLDSPFYHIAMQRVGWLGLFMISLSLTALIMSGFEHVLAQQVELAFFVPFLAGHGGNTGGQAVGTVLSALSAGIVTLRDAPKIVGKEALSGLTMGCLLGSIVGPVAHFGMGISVHVSTVICCTLPLISTIAATLGSSIPFLCLALGLNPSVIAAPAMTSLVDVSGLLSYFLIAKQVFAYFGIQLK